MQPCYYGPGCTRKDCIYRHDIDVPDAKKTNEPCLAFLAGTCAFTFNTCKKRHPAKPEADRLRAKYAQIKCRHGDDCRTTSCLYSHPRDQKNAEPVAFLEHNAFPPLSGGTNSTTNKSPTKTSSVLPGSAWKAAPVVTPAPLPEEESQEQVTTPISAQAPAWFPGNPQEEFAGGDQQYYSYPYYPGDMYNGQPSMYVVANPETFPPDMDQDSSVQEAAAVEKKNLNVNAKSWTPPGMD